MEEKLDELRVREIAYSGYDKGNCTPLESATLAKEVLALRGKQRRAEVYSDLQDLKL